MKCTLMALAAATLSTLASARIVSIDTFTGPDTNHLGAALNTTTTVADAVRTSPVGVLTAPVAANSLSPAAGSQTFASGLFELANSIGRDSEVVISWALAGGVQPADTNHVAFFLEVVLAELNLSDQDFLLDKTALASFKLAPPPPPAGL